MTDDTTRTDGVFALPERLAAKGAPASIAADEERFAAIAAALEAARADLDARLETERRRPGGAGQAAMDRDLEVRRLSARRRMLGRYGVDLCLGRIVPEGGGEPLYIGRFGLADADGRRLLTDWRAPAAEPYFAATRAHPSGLASRRRYRWSGGRVVDYWDEALADDAALDPAALDDQSAFIASLGSSRTPRMRDVLGTIQADQDAIVRADAQGALVVDGGPGTGKTVVALHRAAYLLYADPRLGPGRGGVLVVGPHAPYLAYVEDVLPNLGEESVQTCTLRDLVPEGRSTGPEHDPAVARLKASARLLDAVDAAVAVFEEPPTRSLIVETPWAEVRLDPEDWADTFAAADPGTPHNEAREAVWDAVVEIVVDAHGDAAPAAQVRRELARDEALVGAVGTAWPLLDADFVVGALWTVPALLRRCAPWLDPAEVALLQRDDGSAWTDADLPFLDAARRRLGDREASARRRRTERTLAVERERMSQVVDDLIAADPDGEGLVTMLRVEDAQNSLVDASVLDAAPSDALAGPFAHVIVDEAQELTDAQWRMLLARVPSRSITVVGDRAQARDGFPETWHERLSRVGLRDIALASLTINYRTPEEVMAAAEPVIRAALPDANVPVSVRRSGIPVRRGTVDELPAVLETWSAAHPEGTTCVIGADPGAAYPDRVRALTPILAKGLEFDLVVLVDPAAFGEGVAGAVDRYVAMTRATRELVILEPNA